MCSIPACYFRLFPLVGGQAQWPRLTLFWVEGEAKLVRDTFIQTEGKRVGGRRRDGYSRDGISIS